VLFRDDGVLSDAEPPVVLLCLAPGCMRVRASVRETSEGECGRGSGSGIERSSARECM